MNKIYFYMLVLFVHAFSCAMCSKSIGIIEDRKGLVVGRQRVDLKGVESELELAVRHEWVNISDFGNRKEELIVALWDAALPQKIYVDSFPEGLDQDSQKKFLQEEIGRDFIDEKNIFTVLFGRNLFVKVSGAFLDVCFYNLYNGKDKAQYVINQLRLKNN